MCSPILLQWTVLLYLLGPCHCLPTPTAETTTIILPESWLDGSSIDENAPLQQPIDLSLSLGQTWKPMPTTILLPDGRRFWPSDSQSVLDGRPYGIRNAKVDVIGKFYKRLFDEQNEYEEKNVTGKRMKLIDDIHKVEFDKNMDPSEKAWRLENEFGCIYSEERANKSGEGICDKPGDVEKLAALALKGLKLNDKWFGRKYTTQRYLHRAFTTMNWDIDDMYSRYYAQSPRPTLSSLEEEKLFQDWLKTNTEYTTIPLDVQKWKNALELLIANPNYTCSKDYLEEAYQNWIRFSHPTTEHVEHKTINLTVFFNRRYTMNDTFDYFSLRRHRPKGWTDPTQPPFRNKYELKEVVIARMRNQTTKLYPRADFFFETYEEEYNSNNTYSDLDNLDFHHFQGNSSEVETYEGTPKRYPSHVPTCRHGFAVDENYSDGFSVSENSVEIELTTRRSTTGKMAWKVEFRPGDIDLDPTPAETKRRRRRKTRTTTTENAPRETCEHGLEMSNTIQENKLLREAFERKDVGETRKKFTRRSKAPVVHNSTRTVRTRRTRLPSPAVRKRRKRFYENSNSEVRRQFAQGSNAEYVDQKARDAVYEMNEGRRHHDNTEEHICRKFKEDLNRKDSFDNLS